MLERVLGIGKTSRRFVDRDKGTVMEAYELKDSKISWQGFIPDHWKKDKLFRLCEKMGSGGTPTSTNENYYNGSIPWIQSGDLNDSYVSITKKAITEEALNNSSAKIFPKGTLLVAMYGATIGKLGIMEMDAATNQACCALQVSKKFFSKFTYYLMLDMRQFLINEAYGGGQPNISQETLKRQYMFIPNFDEQKAIADYLDKACQNIDKTITLKQQQLDKLEAYRKSVIHEAVTKGLDKTVPMKDSGVDWLGNIPKRWSISQLKYVIEFHDNRRIPLNSEERGVMLEKSYDYYGASGVIDKVDNYIFDEPMILLGEDGANLITRSKPLAFIARGKYWVNNHAHILKPKRGNIEYWTYILENMEYSLYVTGAAQPKLSSMNLGKVKLVYVKNIEEQNTIADYLDKACTNIDKTKETIAKQIKTLTQYRQSLIHECVTGKKRVYQSTN